MVSSNEEGDFVSSEDYVVAFLAYGAMHPNHVAMLKYHRKAPDLHVTATQMAKAVSYKGFSAANLQYGKLSRKIAEILSADFSDSFFVAVLSTFSFDGKEWHWHMRPEVAEALDQIEWKRRPGGTHYYAVRREK